MTPHPGPDACELEPLAFLGAIQPHGGLLLCDPSVERILAAAIGTGAILGMAADPRPGEAVAGLLPPALIAALRQLPPGAARPQLLAPQWPAPQWPASERLASERPASERLAPDGFECLAHRSAEGIVVEWLRPNLPPPADLGDRIASLAAELAVTIANRFLGAQALAQGVAAIAGYDRVMVYRFHPDWSGEVIAEARRPDLPPLLGLRYPAGDIPAQARELYRHALLRVVADVQDVVLPLRHAPGRPPDLGMAVLRAVSPMHIQYLRNMGVRATLTVSLLHRGALWGLIACHHGAPILPAAPVRQALAQAGTLFSGLLERVALANSRRREEAVEALRQGPGQANGQGEAGQGDAGHGEAGHGAGQRAGRGAGRAPEPTVLARLLLRHDGLAAAADADGIAWVGGDTVISVGLAPDVPTLRRLATEADPAGGIRATDRLGLPPPADPRRVEPAGMLAATLPEGGWLALFRRELTQEIHWAGNPAKATEPGPQGQLSPRRSFALWREQVRGAGRPWGEEEHALLAAAAGLLAAAPRQAMVARAAAETAALACGDNAALQSLAELLAPHSTALLLHGRGAELRLADITPALATLLGVASAPLRGRPWAEVAQVLGIVALGAAAGAEPGEERLHLAFSPVHGPLTLRLGLETALQLAAPGAAPLHFDALVAEDETRSGRLSAALRAAALQAERARRAREALLRNAGHELLTPLNAIIGFGDLLAAPELDLSPAAARDYAGEVVRAGKAMLRLVENLLLVSRIEAGQMAPRPAAYDLAALLRDQAETMRPLFDAKPVRLLLAAPAAVPCIGDATMLAQALVNLLSNALQFTPVNGEVACRLDVRPGQAELRVADGGPGIPPEARQRIFEAFQQVDGSIRRPHGGAGLGLFIARNMVELMGGSLGLEVPASGGCVFVLRLPTEPHG